MRDPGNEVGYSKLLLFSRNYIKDLRISAKFRYKQMAKLSEIKQNDHLKHEETFREHNEYEQR